MRIQRVIALTAVIYITLITKTESQNLILCSMPRKSSQCVLQCETKDFDYPIVFSHPANTDVGSCARKKCHSNYPNYSLRQLSDENINVTEFIIADLDSSRDQGEWVCSYGNIPSTSKMLIVYSGPENVDLDVISKHGQLEVQCMCYCVYPLKSLSMHLRMSSKDRSITKSPRMKFSNTSTCGKAERIAKGSTLINQRDWLADYLNISCVCTDSDLGFEEIKNIPYTFEGVPEMPFDIQIRQKDITSVAVIWKAGYNEGNPQTFVLILQRFIENDIVSNKSEHIHEESERNVYTFTFLNLTANADYTLWIYSINANGESNKNGPFNFSTYSQSVSELPEYWTVILPSVIFLTTYVVTTIFVYKKYQNRSRMVRSKRKRKVILPLYVVSVFLALAVGPIVGSVNRKYDPARIVLLCVIVGGFGGVGAAVALFLIFGRNWIRKHLGSESMREEVNLQAMQQYNSPTNTDEAQQALLHNIPENDVEFMEQGAVSSDVRTTSPVGQDAADTEHGTIISDLFNTPETIEKGIEDTSIAKLKSWVEDDETFFDTKVTECIYKETVKEKRVIVCGNQGSGKSANVHHIALKLQSNGYMVHCVQGIKEMIEIVGKSGKKEKQVYVIDDVFGVNAFEEDITKWMNKNKNKNVLQQCLNDSNITMLFTSSSDVLANDKLSAMTSKFSIVNISDKKFQLSSEECVEIFRKHATHQERDDLLTEQVISNVKEIKMPNSLFPLLCRLYTGYRDTKYTIEEYFNMPEKLIQKQLELLRVEKPLMYFCLLACLLLDNNLPAIEIDVEGEQDDSAYNVQDVLEIFRHPQLIKRRVVSVKMSSLSHSFLQREGNAYHFISTFIHNQMIEHINGLSSDMHEVILKHCGVKFLTNRVYLSTINCEDSKYNLSIKPELNLVWGERVLQIIKDGISDSNHLYSQDSCSEIQHEASLYNNSWHDVFRKNPCVNEEEGDKAISNALSRLSQSAIESIMCTQGYSIPKESRVRQQRHTALHWAARNGLKHVVIATMNKMTKSKLKETENHQDLLNVAYETTQHHKKDVIKALIENGAKVNTQGVDSETSILWNFAVHEKDYEITELLVKHGANVNQCNNTGTSLLCECQFCGHESISKLLIKHGAKCIYKNITYSAFTRIPDNKLDQRDSRRVNFLRNNPN